MHALEVGTNDAGNPRANAVVLIGDVCTGTLIAPNVVLTAAHCGWGDNSFATGNWTPIPAVTISFGPIHGAAIATAIADAVSVPPLATAGPLLVDDIALLRLTADVAPSIAQPRPTYVDRPAWLTSSTPIAEVGYGGGRNRRIISGRNYRDWLLPDDRLMNAFTFLPDAFGAGIGDRGTNIEQGDGGGPILAGSQGFVIGELSWWDPYGIATFGPGGEGRPSIRAWLNAKAPQKPDLAVASIAAAGCSGTSPVARITVENRGVRTAAVRVDVFRDQAAAPGVGTLSPLFRSTGSIVPGQSLEVFVAVPVSAGSHWIDAIVDSPRAVVELDELANVTSALISFPICP